MNRTLYLVLGVMDDIEISIFGNKTPVSFKRAGYAGMCPLFNSRSDAEKWRGNNDLEIIELHCK